MAKVTYDSEVKILSIRFKKNKIADSSMEDNCVIDYDSKGSIVNIDVMDVDIEKIPIINGENTIIKK